MTTPGWTTETAIPDNDIHQFIVATAGAPFYTWKPPYDGNNGEFVPQQICHVEDHYGYMLVNVDDLEVTLTWMQRRSADLTGSAVYEAQDVWKYEVSPNVVVLHPAAGEWVPAGQPYTIRWKTIEGTQPGRLLIEYSLNDGIGWAAVAQADNTGTYEWSVPAASSNSCLLRITGIGNPNIYNVTDGTFSIAKCPVEQTADLNGDCRVDFADLAIFASQWLASTSAPHSSPNPKK